MVVQSKHTAVLSWDASSGFSVTVQATVIKATGRASRMMRRYGTGVVGN